MSCTFCTLTYFAKFARFCCAVKTVEGMFVPAPGREKECLSLLLASLHGVTVARPPGSPGEPGEHRHSGGWVRGRNVWGFAVTRIWDER